MRWQDEVDILHATWQALDGYIGQGRMEGGTGCDPPQIKENHRTCPPWGRVCSTNQHSRAAGVWRGGIGQTAPDLQEAICSALTQLMGVAVATSENRLSSTPVSHAARTTQLLHAHVHSYHFCDHGRLVTPERTHFVRGPPEGIGIKKGQGLGGLTNAHPFLTSQCLRWSPLVPATATASMLCARRSARRLPVLEPRHQGPRRCQQVSPAPSWGGRTAVPLPCSPAPLRAAPGTPEISKSHRRGTVGHLTAVGSSQPRGHLRPMGSIVNLLVLK